MTDHFQILKPASSGEIGIYPHSINDFDAMPHKRIVLNYKSISWNHITAGTSAYSIWEDRIY
ncbi:hypothetical protein XNC1_0677 [Xenorhabdus nematophila ATCC 19061]|uniref:Uncharacterized protein n=1 Tax=Xenorhabdus nematophila (strain ATCC 19061 / DSM 3370 / CCUG 14189 / LMG 1036 / NCIMB 9965 / AN6) TaxID=406817 RepID=D3VJJ2_XENNA|nr:hypothetical protein XNC1_0677 [Xenorhabdus nematophila ATCC 19061]